MDGLHSRPRHGRRHGEQPSSARIARARHGADTGTLDKSAPRRSETPSSDPEELDDDDKPLWDGKASLDM
eukprot:9675006-Prorocentrum_lima.AAC.1